MHMNIQFGSSISKIPDSSCQNEEFVSSFRVFSRLSGRWDKTTNEETDLFTLTALFLYARFALGEGRGKRDRRRERGHPALSLQFISKVKTNGEFVYFLISNLSNLGIHKLNGKRAKTLARSFRRILFLSLRAVFKIEQINYLSFIIIIYSWRK